MGHKHNIDSILNLNAEIFSKCFPTIFTRGDEIRDLLFGIVHVLIEPILSYDSRPYFENTLLSMQAHKKSQVWLPFIKTRDKAFTHTPLKL